MNKVPYPPCGCTGFGGFPGPMKTVDESCCPLGAYFMASMERLAWLFSWRGCCVWKKHIFWLSKDWAIQSYFRTCKMNFLFPPLHATSVHGLGTLALGSCSIVKCAVYTLYMGLSRFVSSLGQGSFGHGVCAASSTVGLIRDLMCSIIMKTNGLLKVRGQLKWKK